jgi:hypothetical protein
VTADKRRPCTQAGGPSIGVFRGGGSTATIDSLTTITIGYAGIGGAGGFGPSSTEAPDGQAGTATDIY